MDPIFRTINLSDDSEVRKISEIDITIPALFDPSFEVNEAATLGRMADLKKRFNDQDFLELALDGSGEIVGFHIIKQFEFMGQRGAQIYTLWVAAELRNKGIAKTLKGRAESWAREQRIEYIETWVHPQNVRMVEMNSKNGFEIVSYKMKKFL